MGSAGMDSVAGGGGEGGGLEAAVATDAAMAATE
jgi:hypothetical protein